MNNSEQMMTRYLLGELSEPERAALEEKYFADPQLFDQVVKTENELADKFARGKLSPQTRERFEQSYLTHPKRRERVKFAEALATRLDQNEVAGNVATEPVWTVSGWRRLIMALQGRRPILGFSLALASLLLIIGGVWFFIESRRSRQELAQSQAAQADHARRERELQQQLTDERMRAYELAERQAPQSKLTPPVRLAPTFVSLLLTVGEVRSTDTGPPATLVIPPRTEEVRLQLNLKEHDYPSYRAVLQAVGGEEIFSRQGLKPKTTKSGAGFIVMVPARKFASGDYILTLRGVSQDGEVDDLSKSLFRVEKK